MPLQPREDQIGLQSLGHPIRDRADLLRGSREAVDVEHGPFRLGLRRACPDDLFLDTWGDVIKGGFARGQISVNSGLKLAFVELRCQFRVLNRAKEVDQGEEKRDHKGKRAQPKDRQFEIPQNLSHALASITSSSASRIRPRQGPSENR